jgi:hypothetical protein
MLWNEVKKNEKKWKKLLTYVEGYHINHITGRWGTVAKLSEKLSDVEERFSSEEERYKKS